MKINGLNPLLICRGSLCMLSIGNSQNFNYCLSYTRKIQNSHLGCFVTVLGFYDFTTLLMAITEKILS